MKLKGISKVNEYISPELLPDDQVTVLKNMILDGGVAKKRGGIKYSSLASTGGTIKELFGLGSNLIGLVDIGSTRVLKKFASGAWSSLKTGLSDVGLFGALKDDKLFLTNGTDTPFATDGSTVWDLPLDAPDLSSTTTTSGAGGSLDASSVYRYAIAYVTDKGEVGDYSIIGHYVSGSDQSTDATYKSIDFASLPVSSRADVTGRRIYRTEGDGAIFYKLTDIDNTETTFSDESADTSLDLSETLPYASVPTKASQIAIHKDRLFLGGVTVENKSVVKPPTITMTLSTSDTGRNYEYGYAVTYLDSYGNESALSDPTTIETDNNTGWQNTITYIPKPFVGASGRDTSIVAIKLYRNLDGGTYYHIKTINHTNSGWADDQPYLATVDNQLSNGSAYTAPASTTYPNRIYYSDIDKFGQITALNYVNVYPQDNEDIIGMVDQENGLLVLKEKSICFVYTSGSPYNWRVVKLIENIGCSNKSSIQRAKNAVYFQYNNDFYRYPDMKLISQEFNGTLDGITVTDTAYVSKYNWYVLVSSNQLYIYDERNDTWLHFTPTTSTYNSATETIDGNFYIGSTVLLTYDEDFAYDFNSSREANDEDITATIKSKHYLANIGEEIRLRKLFARFKEGTGTITQKIINPIDSTYKSKSYSTSGWKETKEITDSFTGTLKQAHTLRYEITGDIQEFTYMRLDYRLRNRNRIWS